VAAGIRVGTRYKCCTGCHEGGHGNQWWALERGLFGLAAGESLLRENLEYLAILTSCDGAWHFITSGGPKVCICAGPCVGNN